MNCRKANHYKKLLIIACIVFTTVTAYAATVDTVMVPSKSMNKNIPDIVITPSGYAGGSVAYPVLYLLHGAGNDYTEWPKQIKDLNSYVDQYNFIVVCADGGKTSWYFDSPIDPAMKYETFISLELVPWVDANYRTIPDRSKRGITGLSMGGHGAFYLAFRHQDVWGAAGSLSGGLDIRPFPNNWDIAKRLGTYAEHPDNWEKNSVINLLYLLNGKSLKLLFDCGTDDFFYDANIRVHQKMLERNIPHDFISRPGAHEWPYWVNAIKYQLLFFGNFFNQK